MKNNLTFIDLFAGVGGFHFALQNKADCVFASEWDSKARTTYLANHKEDLYKNNAVFAGDITKYNYHNIPDHDILCAGFPCQPFSLAGKQEGFKHATQGTLFYNIIKIIEAKNPPIIFLENVKNLKSHDKGNTYYIIKNALIQQGYFIKDAVLNGTTHGNVPQNRERIFIVGFKNEKQFEKFNFPEPIDLKLNIRDCLEPGPVEQKFYQTNMESPSVKKMHLGIEKKWTIYQYRRYYVRENKNNVCPTLTANMGTGGHNVPLIKDDYGIRKLTPRECFNFQGFPKSFIIPKDLSLAALYKQAGNSIIYPLVERISQNIIKAL